MENYNEKMYVNMCDELMAQEPWDGKLGSDEEDADRTDSAATFDKWLRYNFSSMRSVVEE